MAISREEQLLNELLQDVRESDERLSARDLEARVVDAFATVRSAAARPHDASFGATDTPYYVGFAAAMILVVLFTLRTEELDPLPLVRRPELRTAAANNPVEFPLELSVAKEPIRRQPVDESFLAQSPIEFVPLMPLSEHELAGSFQIVRVQMPRASLGALTSPFEHPSEFVEADVLLGEDGMARAIRVSTNESGYPWRSR